MIKDGRYKAKTSEQPVYIEIYLFLLECLQINEEDRMGVESLLMSPLVAEEFTDYELHEIDKANFLRESKDSAANEEDF